MKVLLLLLFCLLVCSVSCRGRSRARAALEKAEKANRTEEAKGSSREGKLFSLFNVVTFNNGACRSTSAISGGTTTPNRNGTCYTNQECSSRGGSASGSCASGFGVCCVFLVSTTGSTVSENCTYVRNPGFPTATTASTALQYTVQKTSNNVCRLRLDFETFTIQGTGGTNEFNTANNAGGTCQDTFTVTAPTNQRIPIICGQNTGQHIYVELGRLATDTATLAFAFTGTTTSRTFEIKVSQIPCFNACTKDFLPPEGCLQYHTGVTGRITSFNFLATNDNHIRNQDYSACIRQEAGFCCTQYTPCTDANSFSLNPMTPATAGVDSLCSTDYVRIDEASGACSSPQNFPIHNRFCGAVFNFVPTLTVNAPICDCTKPFQVDIFTDNAGDNGAANNAIASRGVCLTYMQIPC